MQEAKVELVFIVESWLNDSMLDSMLAPPGWSVFRRDRGAAGAASKGKGGGVCVIFKNNPRIVIKRVDLPSRFNSLEIVAIDILADNTNNGTRIIVVYYPPDQLSDIYMCKLLISAFMYIGNTNLFVCIIGDLNLSRMDWVKNFHPTMTYTLNF